MTSLRSAELPELAPLLARAGVGGAVTALYGDEALPSAGVLHVASAWDGPHGRRTIRITPTSPKSAWDAFVLGFARARADAIVVTGAILREEPALRYELHPALATYREHELRKTAMPELWVLTSGRALDREHPALHGAMRPVFFTPKGADIGSTFERRDMPEGGARELLGEARASDWLVSIEAGPITHRPLYDAPPLVDELLLTLFEGELASELEGGPMLGAKALETKLGRARTERIADEPAGRFRFLRYRRRRL